MQADGNSFPVFILGWTIGVIGVECDGMTSLSLDATCRAEPKRGRVRALQSVAVPEGGMSPLMISEFKSEPAHPPPLR